MLIIVFSHQLLPTFFKGTAVFLKVPILTSSQSWCSPSKSSSSSSSWHNHHIFCKESGKEHIKNTRHKEGVHQVCCRILISSMCCCYRNPEQPNFLLFPPSPTSSLWKYQCQKSLQGQITFEIWFVQSYWSDCLRRTPWSKCGRQRFGSWRTTSTTLQRSTSSRWRSWRWSRNLKAGSFTTLRKCGPSQSRFSSCHFTLIPV